MRRATRRIQVGSMVAKDGVFSRHFLSTYFMILILPLAVATLKLNVVTMTATKNMGSGVPPMQSAFALALEHMATKYPRLFANYTKTDLTWPLEGPNVCKEEGESLVPTMLAKWYGEHKFDNDGNTVSVILTSLCSWSFPIVGDFARELDILIFPCAAGVVTNKKRTPNAISLVQATFIVVGQAVGLVMDLFQWRHLVIINDKLSRLQEAGRSIAECSGVLIDVRKRASEIQSLVISDVDSTAPGFSFEPVLNKARTYSRRSGPPQWVLVTQATAHDMSMTSGDFVFFYLYAGQVPYEPPLDIWRQDDQYDTVGGSGATKSAKTVEFATVAGLQKVLDALDNVFVIRTAATDWKRFDSRAEAIQRRRERIFGTPYDPEQRKRETELKDCLQYNDFTLACTNAAEVMAYALNSTIADMDKNASGTPMNAADISRHIAGKTLNLTFETVEMTPFAEKRPVVWVQQFDRASDRFVEVLSYDYKTKSYQLISPNRTVKWRAGGVPPDRPICGLLGEKCGAPFGVNLTSALAPAVLLVAALLMLCGILRNLHKRDISRQTWWIVREQDIEQESTRIGRRGSAYTKMTQNNSFTSVVKTKNTVTIRGIQAYGSDLTWYGKKRTPILSKKVVTLLSQIRKLEHSNVNMLVGMNIKLVPPRMFYRLCKRGSLDDLFNTHTPDSTLQISLIGDFTQGLIYLHNSQVKQHGNLKSTKLLLDNQMTLKISDYAHERLSVLLSQYSKDNPYPSFFAPHCWMASEVMVGGPPSQKSDVYAYSIICHQIMMNSQPFALDKPNFCVATSEAEIIARVLQSKEPYFRPVFHQSVLEGPLKPFADGLARGWSQDPNDRPKIIEMQKIFRGTGVAGSLKRSLIERVIKRLDAYNKILEKDVADRTALLVNEQRNADNLLKEMLPIEVVKKLRLGVPVEPEYIDEVSVLFSDISGFTAFVDGADPPTVLTFLHDVYSVFDRAIGDFSVYKLETIGSSYVAVSGLIEKIGDQHVSQICAVALSLRKTFGRIKGRGEMELLVGLHSGPVAVGVVGVKRPRYCLFGDTVNTASRMETNGMPSMIHVSPDTALRAKTFGYSITERGLMEIKGKGRLMTYWLVDGPQFDLTAS